MSVESGMPGGGVLKGFLKGVLKLEEILGWKREVLQECLVVSQS